MVDVFHSRIGPHKDNKLNITHTHTHTVPPSIWAMGHPSQGKARHARIGRQSDVVRASDPYIVVLIASIWGSKRFGFWHDRSYLLIHMTVMRCTEGELEKVILGLQAETWTVWCSGAWRRRNCGCPHSVRRVSLSMIDTMVVALSINVDSNCPTQTVEWRTCPKMDDDALDLLSSLKLPSPSYPHHPTATPPKKTQWPPSSSPPAHSPTTRFKSPAKRSVPPAKTAVCATRSSRKIMRNTLRERSQGARSATVSARVGMRRRIGWAVWGQGGQWS